MHPCESDQRAFSSEALGEWVCRLGKFERLGYAEGIASVRELIHDDIRRTLPLTSLIVRAAHPSLSGRATKANNPFSPSNQFDDEMINRHIGRLSPCSVIELDNASPSSDFEGSAGESKPIDCRRWDSTLPDFVKPARSAMLSDEEDESIETTGVIGRCRSNAVGNEEHLEELLGEEKRLRWSSRRSSGSDEEGAGTCDEFVGFEYDKDGLLPPLSGKPTKAPPSLIDGAECETTPLLAPRRVSIGSPSHRSRASDSRAERLRVLHLNGRGTKGKLPRLPPPTSSQLLSLSPLTRPVEKKPSRSATRSTESSGLDLSLLTPHLHIPRLSLTHPASPVERSPMGSLNDYFEE